MPLSPPFTTSTMVAYMLQVPLTGKPDFDNVSTTPLKSMVDQAISWISSQIEMQFSMAGYVIPLDTLAGETWPTSQTTYLQLVATIGAAAMAGGYALRPAPALSAGRQGGSGNVLQDMFQNELKKIFDSRTGRTEIRFRAQYYTGTPAQLVLTDPKGPTTDFMEGKYDPMRYLSVYDCANRVIAIQQSMSDAQISWDYLYSLFDIDKGFGTSIYEL